MGIDISSTTKTVLKIRNISGGCWQAIAILRALKFQIGKGLPTRELRFARKKKFHQDISYILSYSGITFRPYLNLRNADVSESNPP